MDVVAFTLAGMLLAFLFLMMGAISSLGIQDKETEIGESILLVLAILALIGGVVIGVLVQIGLLRPV